MSAGLVDLVPAAQLLAAVAGDAGMATTLATQLLAHGVHALPYERDDIHEALQRALEDAGVVGPEGDVRVGRAAELVDLCAALAAIPVLPPRAQPDPPIVFSVPPGTIELQPDERLDGLVFDVIRCATRTLVIGGPFWNEAGCALLDEVLVPAIEVRHVATRFIVSEPRADEDLDHLVSWLDRFKDTGLVDVRWFGPDGWSLMHAKFVLGDKRRGYLGTANLTSWGFGGHVEAGVGLTETQCVRFLRFLERLEVAGVFGTAPRPHQGAA